MKKVLFLLILCIIKLNAYEYIIFSRSEDYYTNPRQDKEVLYVDDNGLLVQRSVHMDGNYIDKYNISYNYLYSVKVSDGTGFGSNGGFVPNEVFESYYKNDLLFLNSLYTSSDTVLQGFLNYLYNNERFGVNNYIHYENYELLYNSDGLAVESIVDGVWAGLYDDSQKNKSGYLINQDGVLYKDGQQANYFQELTFYLVHPIQRKFLEADHFATGKACLLFLVTVFTFMIYFWIINHVVRGLNYYKEIRDKK